MDCRSWCACSLLLTLSGPLRADPSIADPSALAASSARTVLDGLIGKHQVVGFTERGGSRFLGRVLSGDHGLYIVQTFHYASSPAAVTETQPQTAYVVGRNGRLRAKTRQVKMRVTTQKAIPDTAAVRALLSGVAGPSFVPSEQPAQREMLAPSDVTCLQELSPPAAAAPKTASANWTLKTLWASMDLPHPKKTAD